MVISIEQRIEEINGLDCELRNDLGIRLNLLLFKSSYSIIDDIHQQFLPQFILNNPMYISVTNPSTDQKLAYQLYFLLRTYRWKKDEYIAEPPNLAQSAPSKALMPLS